MTRRLFLQRSLQASALLAAPQIVPAAVLGKDGGVAPSERIVLGGIGIGSRGTYVLGCFLEEPDVRFVAVCDVKAARRKAIKQKADDKYGNKDCATYRDLRELLARDDIDAVLIATGPNWHATASILAAHAGKDVYCEKPCSKNIAQSLALAETFRRTGRVFQVGTQRRSLPNFAFAVDLARRGKLGKLQTLHAQPAGLKAVSSTWAEAESEPDKEDVDWDLYLGPAAWRPFNAKLLDGFNFEKGGGLTGGGCLEWGSHCVDLCQWANDADNTSPVEYEPHYPDQGHDREGASSERKGKSFNKKLPGKNISAHEGPDADRLVARYANGVKLVLRDDGWLPLGSCPVRFEGETGWVETADDGELVTSTPALQVGKSAKVSGYPANFHVRDFLDCVKSRGRTRANADVACHSHITCHAANIALFLGRKVVFDPVKNEFPGDEHANRLRSEALREPWRL
ncbi:MAG: gfo/Idh/MocA family oxidoreductase [Verrucomicrobia bacterium]|nr:MAG: gfo/Idh/MocA family oxidoreductase [Verrucomicrobiota bacterium]